MGSRGGSPWSKWLCCGTRLSLLSPASSSLTSPRGRSGYSGRPLGMTGHRRQTISDPKRVGVKVGVGEGTESLWARVSEDVAGPSAGTALTTASVKGTHGHGCVRSGCHSC